ncbi:MAG: high-affinity choline transporter BetT, partial [Actinomycetia bacterium]|nr:high-affinity choline transporter BetT [Actinomycetes bacterium]
EVAPFTYQVQVSLSPVPAYGGRMLGARDQYARLEVRTSDGAEGYDVMGYTHDQVIDDCIAQYERHLETLRLDA